MTNLQKMNCTAPRGITLTELIICTETKVMALNCVSKGLQGEVGIAARRAGSLGQQQGFLRETMVGSVVGRGRRWGTSTNASRTLISGVMTWLRARPPPT